MLARSKATEADDMTTVFSYGRLGGDPRERNTKTGAPMATASLAAEVGTGADGKPETLWLSILAFGSTAADLLACSKGDAVGVAGKLQVNRWTDDAGDEHERLQVVAASIAGARTVCPGGGKRLKASGNAEPPAQPQSGPGRFEHLGVTDDDIPF